MTHCIITNARFYRPKNPENEKSTQLLPLEKIVHEAVTPFSTL
jgi:hypothetical protein